MPNIIFLIFFVFLLILYIQTIKQIDIVREINEIIKRVSLSIKLDFIEVSHSILHNRLIQYDSSQSVAKTDILGPNFIENTLR